MLQHVWLRLGLRHLMIVYMTFLWWRICYSLNGGFHLSNFCISHRSASDIPCFVGDQGGSGSCFKSANYIETAPVTTESNEIIFEITTDRSDGVRFWDPRFWGGGFVSEVKARIRPEEIWIWIQQIPSVNFEENVISNGHFESILFNERVSISWLFLFGTKSFFCYVEILKYWTMKKIDMRLYFMACQ